MSDLTKFLLQQPQGDSSTFTVRAPGRVNLIGEHVDYNDGYVLPMAISLETTLLVSPRNDNTVQIYAVDFDERQSFDLNVISKQGNWIDYVQGVAVELQKAGVALRGFEGVVTSTIPMASGLSSSAAIEVAAALAFTQLANAPMPAPEMALLCQRAENGFIGVNSGIMDQMAVAACKADNALLIDCRSLELQQVPFQLKDHAIVVTDSGAPRELASSAYNERRAQCEEGLAILQRDLPHVKSLRDVTPADLEAHAQKLPPVVEKRVRHVVEEIARTEAAVKSLQAGDLIAFGAAMNDSHQSLARLYEVSSDELDWLTSWARQRPSVLGSRLTGAGFGGCTVTLIEKVGAEAFMAELPEAYKDAMNRSARCWVCEAEEGARVEQH